MNVSLVGSAIQSTEINLLHVDDDAEFAALASTFLERADDRFSVETVTNADRGLRRLADADIDCIVSDYDMPGRDGIEFLEIVRADYPDLPFILYTGKGSEAVASEAFSAGATDYLQKEHGTEQYTLLAKKVTNYVEKYRTEREMRRRARAMETAGEGIAILDETGHYVSVNEAYTDICATTADEMIGAHWTTTVPDDEAEWLRRDAFANLSDRGSWTGETVGRREDGSTFPKRLSLARLDDGGHVCVARDITDRNRRERELRRYERMVNSMREAVCIYDTDGRYGTVSEYLASFYGTTPTALEGEPSTLVERIRTEADGDPFRALLDGERDELRGEIDGEFPNFGYAVLDYRLTPMMVDGTVEGVVGVARTITDRKQREWQLRRYERIVEASGDPVYTLDAEGRFTFVNDRLVERLGYDRDSLLGEHVSNLMSDDDVERGRRLIQSLLTGPDDRDTFEMDVVAGDGTTVTCENHIALVGTGDEFEGTVGILRDITDRKRREDVLKRKNDRLERFARLVSHDLRNPLNVAQGYLELAREGEEGTLEDAAHALDRCQRLVDDLLSIAHDDGGIDDPEAVPLGTAVEHCWRHVDTRDARLVVDAASTVVANPSRLQQLLENLIRNSIEHGSTGSRTRSDAPGDDSTGDRPDDDHGVTVTVGDLPDGFYVADDGPGIPAAELDRVFDSGYSTSADGTGFGLSIVQEIAEAHGWTAAVADADADDGARIEITGVDRAEADDIDEAFRCP